MKIRLAHALYKVTGFIRSILPDKYLAAHIKVLRMNNRTEKVMDLDHIDSSG